MTYYSESDIVTGSHCTERISDDLVNYKNIQQSMLCVENIADGRDYH